MKFQDLREAKYDDGRSLEERLVSYLKYMILNKRPKDLAPTEIPDDHEWFWIAPSGKQRTWNWDNANYPALLAAAKLLKFDVSARHVDFGPLNQQLEQEGVELYHVVRKVLASPEIKEYKKNLLPDKESIERRIREVDHKIEKLQQNRASLAAQLKKYK